MLIRSEVPRGRADQSDNNQTQYIHTNMATKQSEDREVMTLQDHLIARLEMPVPTKGGGTLKDPVDGHEMTATEAIAFKMMEKALSGDVRSAQFIMQLEQAHRLQQQRKK